MASPVIGMCPVRYTARAARFMAATLSASLRGSSWVPERYGPAIKIRRGSFDMGMIPPILVPCDRRVRHELSKAAGYRGGRSATGLVVRCTSIWNWTISITTSTTESTTSPAAVYFVKSHDKTTAPDVPNGPISNTQVRRRYKENAMHTFDVIGWKVLSGRRPSQLLWQPEAGTASAHAFFSRERDANRPLIGYSQSGLEKG